MYYNTYQPNTLLILLINYNSWSVGENKLTHFEVRICLSIKLS